jgi:ABC-type polysaccharide/polyol phosphate transport system ATPase subunit
VSATLTHASVASASRRPGAGRAVTVQGVAKTFRLPHQQVSTLKERVLHPLRATTYNELRALEDVSFDVPAGEFFGIVGRNGSGKSTLLKCLAGIYQVDRGTISVDGRLSPFIELGVGFNPELTARDNVVINAIMLGLSRRQARDRFDEIIAFAELEPFVDLKLKNYSSGMYVRLAFAVAVQVESEVLLIDEVLAVGDASFQQKCYEQFRQLKDDGRTIVFVTHDMGAVERFCDRAMLLENGRIVDIGEPLDIARAYNEINFGRTAHASVTAGGAAGARAGDRADAEIVDAWFENRDGERVLTLAQGERCRARFEVALHAPLEDPVFAVTLRNEAHHTILVLRTDHFHGPSGSFAAGERVVVTFQFDNWLAASRYTLTPSVARAGGMDALDLRENLASLMTHGIHVSGGVVDVPHQVAIERP